jgi:hypothetical protein
MSGEPPQASGQSPATQPSGPALSASKGGSVETQAISDRLRQLEKQMLPHFNKPLQKQPLAKMIAAYQQIQKTDLPAVDRRIVRARLAALKRNQELAKTLSNIEQVQAQAEKDRQEAERQQEQASKQLPRAQYDAVGKLTASSVYDGESLPRMFRVVEPASGYTVGYLEPKDVNVQQMLGEVVGVVGTKSYDSSMRLRIFNVERIDVLSPSAGQQAQNQQDQN